MTRDQARELHMAFLAHGTLQVLLSKPATPLKELQVWRRLRDEALRNSKIGGDFATLLERCEY